MHQGTLLVAAHPHNSGSKSIATLNNVNTNFVCPHVLLSPNNATASCLEFPFYYPVHYMKTMFDPASGTTTSDSPYLNSGYLVFSVLNALQGGTTSSNSVTVNISVKFDKLEFYVPKAIPAPTLNTFRAESGIVSGYIDGFFNGLRNLGGDMLDSCRKLVRTYTGLHQPNLPVIEHVHRRQLVNYQNLVEGPTFIERMDPFINHDRIHNEPYFNTRVDEMFMPFLLSKPQYLNTFTVRSTDTVGTLLASLPMSPFQIVNGDRSQHSLQNLFYLSSRYWRGNIVFYLHSSMSNMHFLKTLCVKQYTSKPDGTPSPFNDVLNLPSQSVEFSSGGQIAKITIPYYQDKGQIYCSTNSTINALLSGRFNVYLQQPLVNSGTTADNVAINVFYALEDFNFYGHNVNTVVSFPVTFNDDNVSLTLPVPAPPVDTIMKAETSFTPYNVNNQQMLETVNVVVDERHSIDMRPIVSVRDYVRRYQPLSFTTGTDAIELTRFFRKAHSPLSYMFNGFLGGLRVKLEFPSGTNVDRITYYPPNEQLQTDGQLSNGNLNPTQNTVSTSQSETIGGNKVFEFIIVPKTPFKFNDINIFESSITPNKSMGILRFQTANGDPVAASAAFKGFIASTDEARLGFQTLVPAIFVDTQSVFADGIASDAAIQNRLYYYKN
jgi:hypothetical protein